MHKRALQHDNEEVVKLKPLGSNGFYTNSLDLTFRSQRDNYLLSNPNLFWTVTSVFIASSVEYFWNGFVVVGLWTLIPFQTLFDFHSTLISLNSVWAQTIMGYFLVVFLGSETFTAKWIYYYPFTNKAGDILP